MNPFNPFGDMIRGQGNGCVIIGKALATRLDVPYYEDRQTERLLGHRRMKPEVLNGSSRIFGGADNEERLEGPLLPTRVIRLPDGQEVATDEFPPGAVQLTEEVWTRNHGPDSYNDVDGALQRLPHGITGTYYHYPSMNLVLVSPLGDKVGIRSVSLMRPMLGPRTDNIHKLARLKKAAIA